MSKSLLLLPKLLSQETTGIMLFLERHPALIDLFPFCGGRDVFLFPSSSFSHLLLSVAFLLFYLA